MDAKKNASPIELAALLMDAVCGQDEKERDSLQELAAHLKIEIDALQAELLFLRAFAVEFSLVMALGEVPEKDELLSHYYNHWERLDNEAGPEIQRDLQQRIQLYSEATNDVQTSGKDLRHAIGQVFAGFLSSDETQADLTHLGGSMFGALSAEIIDLLTEVDIVLLDGEDRADEPS